MLILLWNCRGSKIPHFHSHLQELINHHKPTLIILTETKVAGIEVHTIMNRFNFENSVKVDIEGASRGLYAMWNNDLSIQAIAEST